MIVKLFCAIYNFINVSYYKFFGKRSLDFCSAAIILLFLLPLFLFISILIKLDSKGPTLYKQKRIGKDGKKFNIYKFRTMYLDSDLTSYVTSEDDPRITRVGKLLRPVSIDELPQLINILRGEMSFIGPRPLSEKEYNEIVNDTDFPEEFKNDLIPSVKPGILGLAIFYGREKISYKGRCKINKKYEENISLIFDSYISWLTMKKYWFTYLLVISLFLIIPLILIALL